MKAIGRDIPKAIGMLFDDQYSSAGAISQSTAKDSVSTTAAGNLQSIYDFRFRCCILVSP